MTALRSALPVASLILSCGLARGIVPTMAVRTVSVSATPVELTLTPALEHEVLVLAEGRQAESA
jgi:hypothetical protein